MEDLKGFYVTSVQKPGFTDDTVDSNFDGWSQVPVEKNTLWETADGCITLFGEDTAKVRKLWDSVNSVASNGERWTGGTVWICFLGLYLSLFRVDNKTSTLVGSGNSV